MNAIETLEMASTSQHERELTITVASKLVSQEFTNAFNKIQRVASRPGFRPGKMPKNMVLNFYGAEIKQKLIEKLIEKSFEHACKEKEVIPVSQPKMEPMGEVDQEKAFTYRAIFQVKPKVEVPNYQGLKIELKRFVFDETDVDDEINSLRENQATFVEPSGRSQVGESDLVQCDSEVKIDGAINPKYSHKDYAVPMFADSVPPDLKAALMGKQVGDVAHVNYDMPTEHQDDEISGKNCEMILTIRSFKERVLPALDDEFAKDLSDKFSSLLDIKESIRLRFNITTKRRDEYFKQDAITKALIEHNPVDVPPALVERMAMSLINRELEAMGEKVASELVKNHWQEVWQSVQDRALFRVKAELLFEELINVLDVKTTDDEVAKRVDKIKNINKEDAKYSIQVEKLLSAIESQADITVVEEPLFKKGS